MPHNYVRMTKEELLEKISHAKRLVDIAEEKWFDDSDRPVEVQEIDRKILVSLERSLSALKSNYQRWYVGNTPHRREEYGS